MKFSVKWNMPSRWTFSIPAVKDFLDRNLAGCCVIIDPFSGQSRIGTHRNDLASGGMDAGEYCELLLPEWHCKADAILFDPPYSPRQISECYKKAGIKVTEKETQNASLYSRVRRPLSELLKPGGLALSFGWQSGGFGKSWPTIEIMLVQHGGAHNDTICVAQRKPE